MFLKSILSEIRDINEPEVVVVVVDRAVGHAGDQICYDADA